MQRRSIYWICLLACLAIAVPALAQSGHPLKGSWSGEWGPSKADRSRVLLEFNWDGKNLTGTLNPGPDGVPMTRLTLEPPKALEDAAKGWPIHFEGDAKDAQGKPVHVVVDGMLENIGAFRKVISGSWTEGTKKGYFEVIAN
jgi:hypothetical protein